MAKKLVPRIEPGRFVDRLVAKYLNIPVKKYSTSAKESLILLSKLIDRTPSGFSINFMKQINSQHCKITLFSDQRSYSADSGYLPMGICLLFINSWVEPLRNYNLTFLKMQYEKHLYIQERIDKYGFESLTEEEEEFHLHPDITILFQKLSDAEIEALIKYANQI